MERKLLIKQAEELINNSGEEWVRCAIGRAYYYLYHNAILFTDGKIPVFGRSGERLNGGMHKKLQEYFSFHCDDGLSGAYNPELLKKLGVFLKLQHSRRLDADYRLFLRIDPIVARSSIREIKKMVYEIEKELSKSK
ncbi:hypothetical protein [Raoultella ornithinolytica]|uniref:hypothetical protein n=1 Tax=Raoultella ornithinolytica TaxID=54291 RepID=UPI0015DCB46A|nr:hypothetical protein [Raoultella ornithinolytica]BBQ88759.1 hypothetical protein WP3W18E06_18870 [Raoultella ornithinolytica]